MRLIDADKIVLHYGGLAHISPSDFDGIAKYFFEQIQDMPTVGWRSDEGIIIDEVLEFIYRRFPKDSDWVNGNCYYFSLILQDRFPGGEIYYDVIDGHFLYCYNGKYYDLT